LEFGELMPYILVCDDHPVVGSGLVELLKNIPNISSCVYKASAQDCLVYLQANPNPLLVIVDFWILGKISRELVIELKALGLSVLMISADDDPLIVAKSKAWGADGFVSKQESPSRIRDVVISLVNGGTWFASEPQINLNIDLELRNLLPISAQEIGLTTRQGQILALILEGHPNKKIAQKLLLSEATVKEHITGIFQRTGSKTRMELVTLFKHRKIEWD
jgi:DNA-binding NarL/FixJ family response regulator